MRSAVSAILSEPSEASSMAFPDYGQTSSDHRRGLILILSVGSKLSASSYAKVRDRVANVTKVHINRDANDLQQEQPRTFRVRYTNTHPLENNEWGDFQMHRNVIGLVCVGGYSSPQELCELSRLHDVAKGKYAKSLLDTRLVAIGVSDNENCDKVQLSGEKTNGDFDLNGTEYDGLHLPQLETNQINSLNGQNATTTVCFYQHKDYEDSLEADMVDFLTGIYWILESKRRELSKTNNDKLPFFCAPFEKKDFVGLDLESRSNKKRTFGRFRKHLGDLCLLCDMIPEAWTNYESSTEILRSCNDWIWLAGAMEGLCAISVMVLYPNLSKGAVLASRTPSLESLSSLKKKISFDEEPLALSPHKVLKGQDIIEKYKECVVHYSKYRHAGVIETEASIKAVRVLTEQCNYLLAAEFLQNIVFINLQMNDEEKIQRFSALAELYRGIGFRRKAAFFLRVAAMRCVAPQNPHPDWTQCYGLLHKANPGYCIDLCKTSAAANKADKKFNGWPALQVQLLQEMVGTARRMGSHAVATRHMTFLLEVMFDHLSDGEKSEFSQQLCMLTSRNPELDVPLTLDDVGGHILPPIPLYKVPRVSSFSVCPLASQLMPRKKNGGQSSVFVFTPITFGGGEDTKKVKFQWVAEDVAEVCLTLFNPLPVEIKVVGLALLHEGVEFENFPSTLSLAPNSGPHAVSLLGVPRQPGDLKILGYKLNVLGVQSSCKLRGPKGQAIDYTIRVIPSMPQLDCTITRTDVQAVDKDEMLRLYLGESASYECTITNISNIKANCINLSVSAHPYDFKEMISLTELMVNDNSELDPGDALTFKLDVKALKLLVNNTFLMTDDNEMHGPSSIGSSGMSRQESGRWSGKSEPGSASGSVKRPSFVTIDVKISYSGGDGGNEGYRRELLRQLKVDICPSALVTKWDILPSEIQHENYLVLDISNQSIHEMEIEYGPLKKIISIEPQDECRIPVPVSKFALNSNENNIKDRQSASLRHLEETLHIRWALPRLENRFGVVSLRDVKLDDQMISSLELCPLEWSLKLNERPVLESSLEFSLGREICLEMSVINQFKLPIQAKFDVDIFLEDSNDHGLATVLNSQPQSELFVCPQREKIHHSTVILPLTSGVYDVICSCIVVKDDQSSQDYCSKYPKLSIHINDDI